MSYKATKDLMLRVPKDPDEELDPTEWYGRIKISAKNWRELWGIPDWRDVEAYPQRILPQKKKPAKHEELSPDQWRWEFLRRDSDYREDYEASYNGQLPYAVCESNDPNATPQKRRSKKQEPKEPPLHYDLASMIEPSLSWRDVPKKLFLQRCRGGRITSENAGDVARLFSTSRIALFAFDVHRPLAEQIARAQEHLYELQRTAIKAESDTAKANGRKAYRRGTVGEDEIIVNSRLADDYRHYLRLLDAYSERATTKDMNAILYPNVAAHDAHTKRNKDMRKALHMHLWL